MLQEIVTFLGGTTIMVAAVAWVTRSIVTHLLSKDIEVYKGQLAKEADLYKAELQRQSLEHEVQFRRVDEKVAERLEAIYVRLQKLLLSAQEYLTPFRDSGKPPKEVSLERYNEARKEFWAYLDENRLYIPKSYFSRTKELATKLTATVNEFTFAHQKEMEGKGADSAYWPKAIDSLTNEAGPLFELLADEFQRRIGVEDSELEPTTRRNEGEQN